MKRGSLILSLMLAMTASAGGNDWMAMLPADAYVRQLSIPGAHDCATGNGFTEDSSFLGSIAGITQLLTISEQWDAGVRAFDLRPTYKEDGSIGIYHGVLETNLSLREALQTISAKLEANPEDFAIIVMRHEDDADSKAPEWADAVKALFDEFDERLVAFSPSLTVGQARGKIMVMTRDTFGSSKAGVISGWSHSEHFSEQQVAVVGLGRNKAKLFAQDFYECGTAERKIASMTAMLDYSTANTSATTWVMNNTSGYTGSIGFNSNITALAKAANPAMADYLAGGEAGRTGIVMMDFAGVDLNGEDRVDGARLVDAIINQNRRYLDCSAITEVAADSVEDDAAAPVYNLSGIRVATGRASISSLPAGIYIINGKKIRK